MADVYVATVAAPPDWSGSDGQWQTVAAVALQGPPGPAGPDGATGPQGNPGAAGATGPAGPAPAGTGFVRVTNGVVDPVVVFGSTSGTICEGSDSRVTGAAQKSANLSDLANASTSRTNLGVAYGSGSGTVCQGNDSRLSDSRAPTGNAAGDLAGTYPNPTIKASVSLTTPVLGVATGTSFAATGAITSSGTAGIGYASGAGGTVTQLTNKSTGVTLSKLCGTITMNGAALAAATIVTFTVTNTLMASTDVVHVQHDSGGTIGAYTVMPNTSAAGSFKITIRNNSAGSLSDALVLRFAVVKAVAA